MQISKLQLEIDNESENRAELTRRAQAASDRKLKSLIETRIEKSDEKLDSMTVLMLHYCAGLQHCLDQEEIERLKQLEDERLRNDREATSDRTPEHSGSDPDNVMIVDYSSTSVEDASSHNDELTTSASMLADGSENAESEVELQVTDVTEMEVSSEAEEEKAEDATVVVDNGVAFSASQGPDSLETEDDDQKIETTAHVEATLAAVDSADVAVSSDEYISDLDEESEVPTATADVTVEACSSDSASHNCVAVMMHSSGQ